MGQNLSVFLGTSLSSRTNPQSSSVLSLAATRREVNQNYKGTFSAERQSQLRKKNWTTLPEEKFFITTWTIATENWKLYVIKHSQLKTKQILVDKILPNIICWGVIRIFLQAIWFGKCETVQSNILRPQLRGRFNKCPRLFPPTFGLIHSEYGVGLSETNPIRSHYLLLKIEEPHLVKRDTRTVTNWNATEACAKLST